MSPVPLVVAAVCALLAMLSAVADGALQAFPVDAQPVAPRVRLLFQRRDAVQRALAFARRILQIVTGAAIAAPLELAERTTGPAVLIALGAGVVGVVITEGIGLALGDALGERSLTALEPLVVALEMIAAPGVALSRWVDRALSDALPPPPPDREERDARMDQFSEVVAEEAGVPEEEEALLRRVLHLRHIEVKDVMIPRVDIVAIDRETPWSEVVDRVRSSEHSRLPVYENTVDNIIGVLYAKDLLAAVIAEAEPADAWTSIVRPGVFIPVTKRIDEQLAEFRASRTHIAIVVDEYGGTAGLVTIEDVLEEIVGEIRDEYDDEEPETRREGAGKFWVAGRVTLEDLSEMTGHRFERDDVTTLGGLVYDLFGRVPVAGEQVVVEGFKLVVEQVRKRRVERVYLERLLAEADDHQRDDDA